MKVKKNEEQSVDNSPLLRIGNKTPMEGVTDTKFGVEMERRIIQMASKTEKGGKFRNVHCRTS